MSVALAELAAPTLFLPGFPSRDPEAFATLAQAAARVRKLAADRAVVIVRTRCAYPGYRDFPALTVRVSGDYLATVGGPWPTEVALEAAQAELRGLT